MSAEHMVDSPASKGELGCPQCPVLLREIHRLEQEIVGLHHGAKQRDEVIDQLREQLSAMQWEGL